MAARLECDKCGKSAKHGDREIFSVLLHELNYIEDAQCYKADWCTECMGLPLKRDEWAMTHGLFSVYSGIPAELYHVVRSWMFPRRAV